jgi:hypothetical protein
MLANFWVIKMHLPLLRFSISHVSMLPHQLVKSLAHCLDHDGQVLCFPWGKKLKICYPDFLE